MKICVTQVQSAKGDIHHNIDHHIKIIRQIPLPTDVIIFPELSLTNYEPELAEMLAIRPDDGRLDVFQEISNSRQVTIGVGAPLKNERGISIGMILFHPGQPRQTYAKKYLHADELPYFVSGRNAAMVIAPHPQAALAICYELSVPEHAAEAAANGATIYLASVAKFKNGVIKASERLADIGRSYGMTVLMSNATGPADNGVCAGGSAVWNDQGELLAQLGDAEEGYLIYDTVTGTVVTKNSYSFSE